MGLVGGGASRRSYAFKVAFPLAGSVRLPGHHRRISLHGVNAGRSDRLAVPAHRI